MGTVARTTKAGGGTNFNSGQTIDPNEVNTDFNTLVTEINGALDDANIETATIPGAKSLRFTEITEPSSPSSNDLLLSSVDYNGITHLATKDAAGKVLYLGRFVYAGFATGASDKAGAVGILYANSTGAPTSANTDETTLYTYTLPASALLTAGAGVRVRMAWGTAANTNTKRIRAYFGSTVILDTTAVAYNNDMGVCEVVIQRIGAATQVATGFWSVSVPGAIAISGGGLLYASPTETLTGTVIIKLTGTNGTAQAGDVSGLSMLVEMLNMV